MMSVAPQPNPNRMRRTDDKKIDRDKELLECAHRYEEHEEWCPECREAAYKLCPEGMDLMHAVYLCLRSSKY